MFVFDTIIMLMGILMSVAFLTLVERKMMSYIQFRKGPNKVSFFGLLQPFSDAMKLFSKSLSVMKFSKFYFFSLAPVYGLLLMMLMWIFYPSWMTNFGWNLEMMLFFSLMGLTSYFLFFCGFSSSSIYSVMGFIRSVAQTISYEVCIIIFILWMVYIFSTLMFYLMRHWENGLSSIFFFPLALFKWMFLSFSESNRSPFDFSEGESEIVSGFNIEYFGGQFSMIFIVEYGMIVFMSFMGSILFFASMPLFLIILLYSTTYIWSRSSFPRFRYDKLMEASWLSLAPATIVILLFLMEYSFKN